MKRKSQTKDRGGQGLRKKRKLELNRETLRNLDDAELSEVAGGAVRYSARCTEVCDRR